MNQTITAKINSCLETLFPDESGYSIARNNDYRTVIKDCLKDVADTAYQEGQQSALESIKTADEIAAALGITSRRVRAIAKDLNIGHKTPGTTGTWLFTESEFEAISKVSTGKIGRPKNIPK